MRKSSKSLQEKGLANFFLGGCQFQWLILAAFAVLKDSVDSRMKPVYFVKILAFDLILPHLILQEKLLHFMV